MKIFHGWWVLLGLFLVYTANNGILLYTLPLFYPALISEFGWDAEQVTRPASLFFILAALLTPLMGVLFDRYSTRLIMLLGIVILIAGLAAYPTVSSLQGLMLVYMVFALGLASCGLVPNMLILTRWFRRYRGLAVGLLLMGSSVGGAVFPLLVRETLATQGWREAAVVVTILGSIMMIGAALLLVRNRPEDMGLTVDGEQSSAAEQGAAPAAPAGPTLKQAVTMPTFYILAFVTGALWFCIVGMLQHQSIFIGQDLGVDIASLTLIFSVFFWCAVVGKLLFGWLGDLCNKLFIMLLAVTSLILGMLLLFSASAENLLVLYGYAALCGVGFSGTFSMIQLVLAEYFAGASFGKILALFTMVDSIAGAMGIRYLGQARVAQESYLPAFGILIALCAISALLVIGLMKLRHASSPVQS